jgi:hypothetical protein
MVEISLKDQILDSQDNIELYLKDIVEIGDAFSTIGNKTLSDKIHKIVICIKNETKKTNVLVSRIEVE